MDYSREAIAEAMILLAEEIQKQQKLILQVICEREKGKRPIHLIKKDYQNLQLLGSLQYALQAAGERLRNG